MSGWTTITAQRLDANWRAIAGELDAPARSRVERVLLACRLPEPVVRLLVATPSLRRAWFVATGVALFFGLSAADARKPDASLLLFLALAPLVAMVGVALAYGPGSDPTYEVALATPISGLRLVLTRTAAVVGCAMAVTGFATLLLRDKTWMSIAWLIPALALPLICLAVGTFIPLRRAATILTVVWLVPLGINNRNVNDPLVVFHVAGQCAIALAGAAAAMVVYARRHSFDRMVAA
jgi:hypothetical protein